MRPLLYPPLAMIEADLFGKADRPHDDGAAASVPAAIAVCHADMPAFLVDMVRRRIAADAAHPPQAPAVGQIRRLDCIALPHGPSRQFGRSFAVLLGACVGGTRWSGWMVAQESDYAADRDLVLQEEDGAIAPEAAMVQAWNPVVCQLRGDEAILGSLSPQALGAVMHLAEARRADRTWLASRPGRIGAWDLDGRIPVVTGTPLGAEDDPRRAYQALYGRLAQELRTAAAGQGRTAGRAGWRDLYERLGARLVRPAWTFAMMALAAVQGAWILGVHHSPADDPAVYRSGTRTPGTDACAPRVRIVFRTDAPYAEVVLALRRVGATVVQGPSEDGEIWVLPEAGSDAGQLAEALAGGPLVERADLVVPDSHPCIE
ncbi:hypothetical protein [Massilia sp. BSC265]|uniref:hypothetical protein n=1 Tax=Massilia sp. BSC265 TaxID=1549812 RepID=UPI0004E9268E|nr:hypothetical protein [Massilia sp. BSC265]KFI09096.1 hypothetical protein JN27_00160 [Massilia sp. BSC265]